MRSKTYLPMGMEGMISCPVAARPPLLRVDWMKDGEPLDLSLVRNCQVLVYFKHVVVTNILLLPQTGGFRLNLAVLCPVTQRTAPISPLCVTEKESRKNVCFMLPLISVNSQLKIHWWQPPEVEDLWRDSCRWLIMQMSFEKSAPLYSSAFAM